MLYVNHTTKPRLQKPRAKATADNTSGVLFYKKSVCFWGQTDLMCGWWKQRTLCNPMLSHPIPKGNGVFLCGNVNDVPKKQNQHGAFLLMIIVLRFVNSVKTKSCYCAEWPRHDNRDSRYIHNPSRLYCTGLMRHGRDTVNCKYITFPGGLFFSFLYLLCSGDFFLSVRSLFFKTGNTQWSSLSSYNPHSLFRLKPVSG